MRKIKRGRTRVREHTYCHVTSSNIDAIVILTASQHRRNGSRGGEKKEKEVEDRNEDERREKRRKETETVEPSRGRKCDEEGKGCWSTKRKTEKR